MQTELSTIDPSTHLFLQTQAKSNDCFIAFHYKNVNFNSSMKFIANKTGWNSICQNREFICVNKALFALKLNTAIKNVKAASQKSTSRLVLDVGYAKCVRPLLRREYLQSIYFNSFSMRIVFDHLNQCCCCRCNHKRSFFMNEPLTIAKNYEWIRWHLTRELNIITARYFDSCRPVCYIYEIHRYSNFLCLSKLYVFSSSTASN